jgi:hypothetical protein
MSWAGTWDTLKQHSHILGNMGITIFSKEDLQVFHKNLTFLANQPICGTYKWSKMMLVGNTRGKILTFLFLLLSSNIFIRALFEI